MPLPIASVRNAAMVSEPVEAASQPETDDRGRQTEIGRETHAPQCSVTVAWPYFFGGYTANASTSTSQPCTTSAATPIVARAVFVGFSAVPKNSR